jgi:hypothetical protein
VIAATVLLAVVAAGAIAEETTPTPTASGPVTVGQVNPTEYAPGATVDLQVPIRVADGHRVQANPASSEFLVPLELVIGDQQGLEFGSPVYPIADFFLLEGSDEPLLTYVGEFEVVVPVTVATDAEPGRREVRGELLYQACNSRMCLFPESIEVVLRFEVSTLDGSEG